MMVLAKKEKHQTVHPPSYRVAAGFNQSNFTFTTDFMPQRRANIWYMTVLNLECRQFFLSLQLCNPVCIVFVIMLVVFNVCCSHH